jgi:hypothetical protein
MQFVSASVQIFGANLSYFLPAVTFHVDLAKARFSIKINAERS